MVGVGCTGKSRLAVKMSEKFNVPFINLDCVDFYIEKGYSVKDSYSLLLKDFPDVCIFDGYKPFYDNEYMIALKSVIGDNVTIFNILVYPNYAQFVENYKKRNSERELQETPDSEETYNGEYDRLKGLIKNYLEIRTDFDFEKITENDVRSFRYQRIGYADVKWQQLKLDCNGKSILDLGCCACIFDKFSKDAGAVKYRGLDMNKAYIFNENARFFDLNKLELWEEKYDYVICTSTFHYIIDKEKFIKECARLSNEMFILETPLSLANGLFLECDKNRYDLLFPTKELLEYWISKYFKSFECLGKSITQDDSYRLIYHCKK